MDQATREDLETIKQAILNELGDVEAIYLFGSVAKGTQNESSDYDILVFVHKYPSDKHDSAVSIINNASDNIKRPLEVFILEIEDLKYSSPFLYEVYHNHYLVHGKNVIIKCEDAIKNIRPFIMDGKQIGYYV